MQHVQIKLVMKLMLGALMRYYDAVIKHIINRIMVMNELYRKEMV
jgi:hypothetical protein